ALQSESASVEPVATPAARRDITNWKRAFDQGGGVVDAFTAAVHAAESGDARAIRAVYKHVVSCQPYLGAPHQPWMDVPGEQGAGGIEQINADERCGLIARAAEFADGSPD